MREIKNFAWPVTDTYSDNVVALKECLAQYAPIFHERGIALFGAGIHGNEFLKLLEMDAYSVLAFIDNNKDKQGGCINQYPIISLEQALSQEKLPAIIVAVESYGAIREQLIAAGLRENEDFFCVESNIYPKYMEEFLRPYIPELLALGDCALSAISLTDTNSDSLAVLLQKKLGRAETKILPMHGMGMGGYYHILRMQIALGMRPKRLLLEVNMETFMPKHHLLPRSQHVGLLEKIYAVPGCADNEFLSFIEQSRKRSAIFQTDFFSSAAKTHKNRISEHSAMLFFKMNYMYSLDTEVEGFSYYLKILDLLKRESIDATIFVPPVNYQYARKLFGDEFTTAYEANLDAIRAKTSEAGFTLLELHYALTPEEFCAVDTPTETSNYAGREKLCTLLTNALQAGE
ncbi:MAG: nucleoside-diphosphate sugar epimerase/dehydratase [Desulfobulbus sp.]